MYKRQNLTSLATFDVTAGTTYIIAFDNKWNSYTFDFTMEENVVITPPPPAEGTVAFTPQTFSGVSGYLSLIHI